ncbi:FecR family protein [Neptunitalea lumnitzerae]|uniref:Iron dicitrate transporter FecR n=1 Tax=Neptunitalea lumnitzerae TaxID=2965509 RepID=A0ABQ5MJQ5_9FLAO|nr:FecR family protein [Neptunitalea sp. Y10]GLB49167.1 iron dicitrate transporter FecR [Neptunitalea sp. Y10]
MKKRKHILKVLTDRFLKGELSQQEDELLEAFIKKEYQQSTVQSTSHLDKIQISNHIWSGIQANIQKTPKVIYMPYIKYVAAACIVIAIAIPFLLNRTQYEYLVTQNSIDSIQLPDGSKIYLGANSSLKYPINFKGDTRKLTLECGNAFFKVFPDKTKPFIVISNDIETKVLGTSFNINTSKSRTEVVVATGKVNVSSPSNSIDLIPLEKTVYKNHQLVKEKVFTNEFSSWFKGHHNFKDTQLNKVTELLAYKYNIDFSYDGNIEETQKITIDISPNESLSQILENLSFITHLNFTLHDKKVIVTNS